MRFFWRLVLLAAAVLGVVLWQRSASAQSSTPAAYNDRLTLAATTATKVGGVIVGRKALTICNLDTATVYIGYSAARSTDSYGIPLPANTCTNSLAGWQSAGVVDVYAYSVAGTAANAIRWAEGR